MRYAGVARRVRKRRKSKRTRAEMAKSAKAKKTLEPTEMGDTETENMMGKKESQRNR
jgi:hypothetical protein